MRINLLGALQVADDTGTALHLPGARLRVLLAALALNAGTPVAGDTLAEFVWDAAPPPGYPTTLRSHVMRLRRTLPTARIETLDTGYTLSAVGLSLDITEFEELCRQAGVSLRAATLTFPRPLVLTCTRNWKCLSRAVSLCRGENIGSPGWTKIRCSSPPTGRRVN